MVSAIALKTRDNVVPEEDLGMMDVSLTSNSGTDDVDRPSPRASVTRFDIFCICYSIVIHIVDILLDLNLAVTYLHTGQYSYFGWTVTFLFVPSFINLIISVRMYNQDIEMNPDPETQQRNSGIASKLVRRKTCCLFIVMLQLAPLLRCMDSLKYAIKSYKYKKKGDKMNQVLYYTKMLKEDQDIALLRVFECFLEAAPQQILQLTILLKNDHQTFNFLYFSQVASICTSLISMGWAMASYNRNIRLAQKDKSNITKVGLALQFLWHFLITVSRIISVSAVASVWVVYTGVYCVIHWISMTIWILAEPSGAMEFVRDRRRAPHTPLTFAERIASTMFASVLGVVYIFIYINPTDGPTFYRHLIYYVVCLIENLIACSLWASAATTELIDRWYYELVIAFCIVPFIIGAVSMILYYKFHHTTKKEKPALSMDS